MGGRNKLISKNIGQKSFCLSNYYLNFYIYIQNLILG